MDRILGSPELLDLIFDFTDRSTDACCARVCKNWFEIAIKQLWYRVDNLQKIFAILSPIQKGESKDLEYRFVQMPTVRDWERFNKYASNVRHLIVDNKTWHMNQVLQEVSRSRTQVDLFPKLKKLNVTINSFVAENIVLFIHNGITELTARVSTSENQPYVERFLTIISERTGNLVKLILSGDVETRAVEKKLISLIQNQRSLEKITLPLYLNTSSIMFSLSHLPKLEAIEFRYYTDDSIPWGKATFLDAFNFKPSFFDDGFKELKTLELALRVKDSTRFFLAPNAPRNIVELYIHTLDNGNVGTLQECMDILAKNCECLEIITFEMTREITTESSITSSHAITLDVLRPLFGLRKLREFCIFHPKPLAMTAQDLEVLARSWPRIINLSLNPEPLLPDDPLFNLSVLEIFAKYCPNLQELQLYVDARSLDTIPAPLMKLEKLEKLCLGASPVDQPKWVAVYLSLICTKICSLNTANTWVQVEEGYEAIDEQFRERREADEEQWDEVREILPLIKRAINLERSNFFNHPERTKDRHSSMKREFLKGDLDPELDPNNSSSHSE